MTSTVIYLGDLRTEATHLASNSIIQTDAPIDNHGKGALFSPTDITVTSLANCMLTVMGIAANTHHINMNESKAEVTKVMKDNPRRIGEINVTLFMKGQNSFSDKEQKILEKTARTCPVAMSLHPDINQQIIFHWP